jgi:formylglycine-generating enzyme required for sulfatase activity
MRQDEAPECLWRVAELDGGRMPREQRRPDVQALLRAREEMAARRSVGHGECEKKRSLGGHGQSRSEIEVRQRTVQRSSRRAERRRMDYEAQPFTAALRADTDRQARGLAWAVLVGCVVVGTLVISISVWIANAIRSLTPPEETLMQASATASAVMQSAPEREMAEVPAGRLTSGAESLSSKREPAIVPNETFKECDDCPEMVVMAAGKFVMGSPDSEQGHNPDESPRHSVVFAFPFAVGRFAVTFDEWDACVAEDGCNGYRPADQGWGRGRRPVTNVSWDDAKAYVGWLSKKTGKPYRLLSEAEREYVTRAGTTSAFWWGPAISTSRANYDGDLAYGDDTTGEFRGKTVVVDSFSPNPAGLYQVHGNVYDWVEDCYHESYRGAPSDGSAWISEDCGSHVARGGSWLDDPRSLRSAYRLKLAAATRFRNTGFRVGRSLNL